MVNLRERLKEPRYFRFGRDLILHVSCSARSWELCILSKPPTAMTFLLHREIAAIAHLLSVQRVGVDSGDVGTVGGAIFRARIGV